MDGIIGDFDPANTNGRNIWARQLKKVGLFTCNNMNTSKMTTFLYADTYKVNIAGQMKLMPLVKPCKIRSYFKIKKDFEACMDTKLGDEVTCRFFEM